ncbi:MAG: putative carbamoyl transferase, NodU family [Candidatus Peregrinibacteria bacterium Greene0416_19]|nr:MAG: putative carbamoyl transferase, NodU family [Candidatus Peregrinibacteria bacterium Greene0416_19]
MPKPIYIFGLSCYYHDSAACLVKDGEVIFAAHEERYTRKKHDDALPKRAVEQALKFAGITIKDIDAVGFYEKPLLKFFDRIIPTYMKVWPRGLRSYQAAMQEWMTKKLWIPQNIKKELGYTGPIYYCQHHESHAASAYYVSGFPQATVVTVDGVGEWATTTIGKGEGTSLALKEEIHFPHSLGLLYSAITYYLGFKVNSAEYKVMGLAPYGQPTYMREMRELIELKEDGSFRLNMKYFNYEYGMTMTGRAIEKLFGQPARKPEKELTQFHKDVARSLQEITEQAMMKIVMRAKELCPSDYLCLAGGVALNCVANGKILKAGLFKDIFIQPASGDAGGALGGALLIWHRVFNGARTKKMEHAFLGNEYSTEEIESLLRQQNLPYERLDDGALFDSVASLLEGDNVIGWFQGRMEYGPRSLGNRSIIADARNRENWQKVNLKIKFRESFRPFAPTVLEEKVGEWFALNVESPYMLLVADTLPHRREQIPAVTHVDGSARIQTIRRDQNPRYYDLIKKFEEKTQCPVIINTSFNVRGEPIVESPKDALNCFLNTHMDYLVLGSFLLNKKDMPAEVLREQETYLKKFELD